MKFLRNLLLIVLVLIVGLVLARNIVAKVAIEQGAAAVAGLPLEIGKLDIGLRKTYLDIENLEVGNPKGFGNEVMVDMPKILVDYNLTNILKGKLHMERIDLNLRQFTVVRGHDGRLNINSIKAVQQAKPASPGSGEAPKKEVKAMPIQLDIVRLRIGKVVYIDLGGAQPSTKEFTIGLDETYRNITEQGALVRLIVLRIMTRTPLAMLTNFDIGGLQSSVSGIVGSATDLASQTAAKGLDVLKSTTSSAESLAGEATGTVKEATTTVTSGVKSLAGKIKNPFGSKD
ncbi:MAG TPA: AsmA family protein [Candidatus Omnitrophota bacterium]|jgi:uncharacterized protein involved in outer membrane biogenesis|nr:MAG: AsmA family protein [Candidatus Omnitrophica bacterium ADurb.Bin314]HOE69310.1 AsmA family protein [Candidatus Omnitrophota bacterium]HQB93949.1 AsmA family protein [Candidatus Omnitrophota bacterium]